MAAGLSLTIDVTGRPRAAHDAAAPTRWREGADGLPTLLVDRADGIATVTMNRPEARNALDLTMREEMLGALDELERDPAVRVVVLTGAGGHFSAGGDVKSMQKKHTAAEGRARVELLNRFVLRLFSFPSRRSPWWTASRSAPGAISRSAAT